MLPEASASVQCAVEPEAVLEASCDDDEAVATATAAAKSSCECDNFRFCGRGSEEELLLVGMAADDDEALLLEAPLVAKLEEDVC